MSSTDENRSGFFIVLGFYIAWMLGIAFFAARRSASKSKNNADDYQEHFLGSKSYGSILLFMTLFSTIYSGYTVVGVPNEAAGLGYIATRWLTSAPMVGVASIIVLPRLRRLSVARNYNSPNDLVTDRFNNRILTVITSLSVCVPQVIYVVAQFYTLKQLIPVLSLNQMNENVAVWFLGAVIYICETIGGFNAVSLTDSIQSTFMIISLILIPILAAYYWGGAGESTPIACENAMLVNCSLPEYAGASGCRTSPAFTNGCLGNVAPWMTLHPATEWSDYFEPVYAVAGTRGVDASSYYNYTGLNMFSFNMLFLAFFLNPHWVQRTFAAKTDNTVKRANMVFTLAALVATLPGVLVGIMIKANLVEINAAGSEPFGLLLSNFMTRGGFAGFVGVVAACSAIAAIMSTADSAIIGVTNVLSTDFLNNGALLGKDMSDAKKQQVVHWFSRTCSLLITIIGICVALYDDDLNDDEEGGTIYGKLITWQNMLLWQALPSMVLAIFMRKAKAWALIAGYVVGFTMIGSMYWYKDVHLVCDVNNPGKVSSYGTPFAVDEDCEEVDIKTFYLDPAIWAGLGNLFVATVLSLLPVGNGDGPAWMTFSNISKHGQERLSYDIILGIMADTVEPIKTKLGVLCIIGTTLACNLSLPFYGDSYDNCNFASYLAWAAGAPAGDCSGPNLTDSGLPDWVVVVISLFIVALLLNIVAWSTWKTIDHEDRALAGFVEDTSQDTSVEMVKNTGGNEAGTYDGEPHPEDEEVIIYDA